MLNEVQSNLPTNACTEIARLLFLKFLMIYDPFTNKSTGQIIWNQQNTYTLQWTKFMILLRTVQHEQKLKFTASLNLN